MSNPGYFLGGMLAGAVGLTAAALFTGNKNGNGYDEEGADFTRDEAMRMDAETVIRHLNKYFLASHRLGMHGLNLSWDSLGLQISSFDLPDDTLLDKARNRARDTLTSIGRKGREQEVRKLRRRIEGLYQQYRPVFVRANHLLAARGVMGISLKDFTLAGRDFTLDNSISNETWADEFTILQDLLQDFVTRTSEGAETLLSRLEEHVAPFASVAAHALA